MAKAVTVVFAGDTDKLKKSLGEVDNATGKMGDAVKKGFAIVGVAAAAAAGAVIAAGVKMANHGEQLMLQGQKAKIVFGDQLSAVEKWANKINESMGVSRRAVVNMASSLQDLLVPMGFSRDRATEMTQKTIELAGALSLWSGGTKDAAEVSDVLTKAMLGERDGLKSLGISISEADVQGKLLAEGKDRLTGAALQQASAEATLALIMEKSTDAQKNAADGANQLTTAKKALSAAIGEVKDNIGLLVAEVVLPALVDGFTGGADAATSLRKAGEGITDWIEANQEDIRKFFFDVGKGARDLTDAVGDLVDKFGGLVAMFKQLTGFGLLKPSGEIVPVSPSGTGGLRPVPRKAVGGPISGPVLVGEQGPELFVPGGSGSIVPRSGMRGSGGVTININAPVYGVDHLTETIRQGLVRSGQLNVGAF